MARFEDSPDLFGGQNPTISHNIRCDLCHHSHTTVQYADEHGIEGEGLFRDDPIAYAQFGELTVCACCFEKVEKGILSRIEDTLPWLVRALKSATVRKPKGLFDQLRTALNEKDI